MRHVLLAACIALALGGCMQTTGAFDRPPGLIQAQYQDEPAEDESVDDGDIEPQYLPTTVPYYGAEDGSKEPPGTIIIHPDKHYLYLILNDHQAKRYGVGVGKQGFLWHGAAAIKRKAEWPSWTPPAEMKLRDPKAAAIDGSMPGGPTNPLGARALYLYEGNKDTLYRIHGTYEPWTIGHNVSSGCIRLRNQDVVDLYNRVPVGAKVIVR